MRTQNSFFKTLGRRAIFFSLVLGSMACSDGWNQNPLAAKDKAFQNPQRQPPPQEKPKGVESDYVRLNHPEHFVFREGVESTFQMAGRILLEGYKPQLLIENLGEFPGAKFDEASGKFTWKPPVGTVGSKNPLTKVTLFLNVRVIGQGTSADDEVVTNGFSVPVEVGKLVSTPEIYSISKKRLTLREGDSTEITVLVRDPDADLNNMSTWPNLQILPMQGYPNISPFVSLHRMLVEIPGRPEFKIILKINLGDQELTKSKTLYGFRLQVYSRYKETSLPENLLVGVLTSLGDLQSTWFEPLQVSAEKNSDYQFLIFDPKEEQMVQVPRFKDLPPGIQVQCEGVRSSRQLCKLEWTPGPESPVGEITLKALVETRNRDASDVTYRDQELAFKMKVLPKVDLPPPPAEPPPSEPSPERVSQKGGAL